ncbi:MAG: calcium-binding protein [Pseudomonadota bacterium]
MPIGPIFDIGSSRLGLKYNPSMTFLSDGTYVVAFEDENGLDDDMYIERYAADGTSLGIIQVANFAPFTVTDFSFPRITDLGNGTFAVNYNAADQLLDNTAFFFNYDLTEATLASVTSQASAAVGTQVFAMQTVAINATRFMNVWVEGDGADITTVYFEVFSTTGATVVGPTAIITYDESTNGRLANHPLQIVKVGEDSSGNPDFRVFYVGLDSSNDNFIRSKVIDPLAGDVDPGETFNFFDTVNTFTNHEIYSVGTDKFFLLFEENGIVQLSASTNAGNLGSNQTNLGLYEAHATVGTDGALYVIGQSSEVSNQFDLITYRVEFENGATTITELYTIAEGSSIAEYQDFTATTNPDTGDIVFGWRDTNELNQTKQIIIAESAVPNGEPELVGLRAVFETLYVDLSGVSDFYGIDETSIEYTWFVNGQVQTLASGSSFTAFDFGSKVEVLVTYQSDFGFKEVLLSAETDPIEGFFSLQNSVQVSGRLAVGDSIEADVSELAKTGLDYTLIWFAGSTAVQIGGTSLAVTSAMLGEQIDLYVSLEAFGNSLFYQNNASTIQHIFDVEGNGVVELDGDTLTGGAGEDTLTGTIGDDDIDGLNGDDDLSGRDGDDFINGRGGEDLMLGGAGEDTLNGSTGNDDIQGGADADVINGGDGDDDIDGDGGDDLLTGALGEDNINGGEGIDEIRFNNAADAVYVDLMLGVGLAGEASGDTYTSVENVLGSDFGDVVVGSEANNLIRGGENNVGTRDELFGMGGNDTLQGEGGADLLVGGAGVDLLQGGAGNDKLIGGTDVDILFGDAGRDEFYFGDQVQVPVGIFRNDEVESTGWDRVRDFTKGDDTFVIQDSAVTGFADLSLRAVGTSTVILYGGDRIIANGTAVDGVTTLDASDFLFL